MIIAFTGFKRSGKDTCAQFLVDKYKFTRFGFADPIRNFVKETFLWDDNWIENHKEEIDPRWGISYRQIAQIVGTEWMQYDLCARFQPFLNITGRNVWAKRFEELYLRNPFIDYVISDLRFPHEVEYIKKLGGIIVSVSRTGIKNNDTHESEKHIQEIEADAFIINDSTLKELETKVDYLLLELRK